jgi:hypothetical protein
MGNGESGEGGRRRTTIEKDGVPDQTGAVRGAHAYWSSIRGTDRRIDEPSLVVRLDIKSQLQTSLSNL